MITRTAALRSQTKYLTLKGNLTNSTLCVFLVQSLLWHVIMVIVSNVIGTQP